MKPDVNPIDPSHAAKRAALTKLGLLLLVIGLPCALIGLGLFFSAFLSFPAISPARPAIGVLMTAAGGFMTVFALQMLTAGNMGRIARYQAGEMMPVAKDMTHESAPLITETARAFSTGWAEGQVGLHEGKVQHACGAWNDPADNFCKGCGQTLGSRTCPSCQARNDADANFCDRCGAKMLA
ncbi:MAG TPA: zinc ribbon domain-containing protein [Isosphaeraceae bacterium]|jgi:ribosomal protein L40E|nr:zinc ribbon domain-containing protein [Isosphaeraceae bacterium]